MAVASFDCFLLRLRGVFPRRLDVAEVGELLQRSLRGPRVLLLRRGAAMHAVIGVRLFVTVDSVDLGRRGENAREHRAFEIARNRQAEERKNGGSDIE